MLKKLGISAVLIMALSSTLLAQATPGWDPTGLQMKRADLQELLQRYQTTANSATYSDAVKKKAREQAALIEQRLKEGDIRTGDRIFLNVELHKELSDTFNVVGDRTLVLPDIGEIKLAGVLRSELQSYLTTQIAKFVKNPVVHARSLIRLEIRGAVGAPGYYTVPSDYLITDALMLARGPTASAAPDAVTVQRGDEVIWRAEDLRQSIIEGKTLDQISVRAGDAIVVSEKKGGGSILKNALVVLSALTSIFVVIRQLRAQ